MLFLPRTIAVYAPGARVASIPASRLPGWQKGGGGGIWPSAQLSLMMVANPGGPCSSSTGSSQGIGDTELCQGPNGADHHVFRNRSRDDEAADANIIAGLNKHPRREIEGLRRSSGGCAWGCRRAGGCRCAWALPLRLVLASRLDLPLQSEWVTGFHRRHSDPGSPTVTGVPVLKKPIVAFVAIGGLLESNRKLYKVPQRMAFAFWFWAKVSVLQVNAALVWFEVQAALLNPAPPRVPSFGNPG